MKIWDIVKTVGADVVSAVVPGGGAILSAVNAFLPDGSKLGSDATGNDVAGAIQSLPAEQRAAVMSQELEVKATEIRQSHESVRAMLASDAAMPQTTRPYIAKGAFHVVAFAIIVAISIWAYGVSLEKAEIVDAVVNGWPFILAVIGPLVVLLHAYFGVLRQEQRQKLDAAEGRPQQQSGIAGVLAGLLKK